MHVCPFLCACAQRARRPWWTPLMADIGLRPGCLHCRTAAAPAARAPKARRGSQAVGTLFFLFSKSKEEKRQLHGIVTLRRCVPQLQRCSAPTWPGPGLPLWRPEAKGVGLCRLVEVCQGGHPTLRTVGTGKEGALLGDGGADSSLLKATWGRWPSVDLLSKRRCHASCIDGPEGVCGLTDPNAHRAIAMLNKYLVWHRQATDHGPAGSCCIPATPQAPGPVLRFPKGGNPPGVCHTDRRPWPTRALPRSGSIQERLTLHRAPRTQLVHTWCIRTQQRALNLASPRNPTLVPSLLSGTRLLRPCHPPFFDHNRNGGR